MLCALKSSVCSAALAECSENISEIIKSNVSLRLLFNSEVLPSAVSGVLKFADCVSVSIYVHQYLPFICRCYLIGCINLHKVYILSLG